MDEFKQKFLAKIDNKGNKKTIENLVVFVIILIATIIFINYIWTGDKDEANQSKNIQTETEIKTLAQTATTISNNNTRNKFRKTN